MITERFKSIAKTAAALSVVFVVMVAALMYNGQEAEAATISGRVVDEDGAPIPDILLVYGDGEPGSTFDTVTDADGYYSMEAVIDYGTILHVVGTYDYWTAYSDFEKQVGKSNIVVNFTLLRIETPWKQSDRTYSTVDKGEIDTLDMPERSCIHFQPLF